MSALLIEWGIKRCNQRGCTNDPNTIVTLSADESPTGASLWFGLCEEHYQMGNVPGGTTYDLDFTEEVNSVALVERGE